MKQIGPGTVIRFRRSDGKIVTDAVCVVFWQDQVMSPSVPAVALTLAGHSWCWAADVVDVMPEHEDLREYMPQARRLLDVLRGPADVLVREWAAQAMVRDWKSAKHDMSLGAFAVPWWDANGQDWMKGGRSVD